MSPKTVGIIPARYSSTRFPAKALVDIAGKTMIRRVYEQVVQADCLDAVYVATDHKMIMDEVQHFGGEAILTSVKTPTGTARCAEALKQLNTPYDFVINIQGDEPFIHPEQINLVHRQLTNPKSQIATLAILIQDIETLLNPNTVKVVFDKHQKALYFSRYAIPFTRDIIEDARLKHFDFFKHIGIYGFRTSVLAEITQLPTSKLEEAESLEQLSWLENGYAISVAQTLHESHGIDTPEDLNRILKIMM